MCGRDRGGRVGRVCRSYGRGGDMLAPTVFHVLQMRRVGRRSMLLFQGGAGLL